MRSVPVLVMLLLTGCDRLAEARPKTYQSLRILIQPLGTVPGAFVDSVAAALRQQHNATISIGTVLALPEKAFTDIRSPRYRADTLIAWLRKVKPDTIDHIIGLTDEDISITKYGEDGRIKEPASKYRDFGIFGLGFMNGPACVVSTYRLGDGKDPRFFARLSKVAVHEVGHNRGLPHCANLKCAMRDAVERMSSVDAAGRSFCPRCASTIGVGAQQP